MLTFNISTIYISIIYLLTSTGYFFLPEGANAFPGFIFLYTIQFIGYFILIWKIREGQSLNLKFFIVLAIVLRILLVFSPPIIEDDYWRYLWDGRVLAHSLNPYAYAPDNPYYDSLDIFYRSKIGFKEFGTIYPPISISIFAIAHLIKPDSLLILKLILTIFEILSGVIVWQWLKLRKQNVEWSLIYFLSPLVLKDIANSGHLDSIAVFFSTLSFYLLARNLSAVKNRFSSSLWVWISFAMAVGSKLYPLILLPLIIRFDKNRIKGFCLFIFIIGLFYLPFLSAKSEMLDGTKAFAKYWLFNASLFRVFSIMINPIAEALPLASSFRALIEQGLLVKAIVGVMSVSFCIWIAKKTKDAGSLPSALSLSIGSVLLLSPVVNSWYVLWILPFVCLNEGYLWLIFSFLIGTSYSWFYDPNLATFFGLFEYFIFYGLMFIIAKRNQFSFLEDFEIVNHGQKRSTKRN